MTIQIMDKEITRDSLGGEIITYTLNTTIQVSHMSQGNSQLSENKSFKNFSDTLVFFSNFKLSLSPEQVVFYDNKYYKVVQQSTILRRFCYECEVIK